jgi:predicted O-methyltransferase YrrM
MPSACAFPDGHFYSPVVNVDDLRDAPLWETPREVLGIDFNEASHLEILSLLFPRFIGFYSYEEMAPSDDEALDRYYTQNSQFSWLDSRALFVLMTAWKPRRLIEVGSGYSSLLMADINCRMLGGECTITCIEPYPRPFLRKGIPGLSQLIERRVQDVPLERFEELRAGDILFIDSSHVAKTGSDVNYLLFEVLPRLRPGVMIHIHDIFLPLEYPREWVLQDNRSWNEQYLVRGLLMYSTAFRVRFGSTYAALRFPAEVKNALNLASGRFFGGGSLWIERMGE